MNSIESKGLVGEEIVEEVIIIRYYLKFKKDINL